MFTHVYCGHCYSPVMNTHTTDYVMESGFADRQSAFTEWMYRSHMKRRVFKCVIFTLTTLCAIGASMTVYNLWLKNTDTLFTKMERVRFVDSADTLCVSSRHIGEYSIDWVAFPKNAIRMMNPMIVNNNGTVVNTVESPDVRACSNESDLQVQRTRYLAIQVQYKIPGLFFGMFKHKIVRLDGDDAICLQHMLDILSGDILCGRRQNKPKENL